MDEAPRWDSIAHLGTEMISVLLEGRVQDTSWKLKTEGTEQGTDPAWLESLVI